MDTRHNNDERRGAECISESNSRINRTTILGFSWSQSSRVVWATVAIVIVLAWWLAAHSSSHHSIREKPQKLYDIIIVGAGTAGSVLARRLSDVDDIHILLIEAGGEETWTSDVPLLAPWLQLTSLNWNYRTVPQKRSMKGMIEQRAHLARGKVLGGSSVINYFLHSWGVKEDFERWPIGWKYVDLLPYFLRSEDYHPASGNDTTHRGTGGQSKVSEFDMNQSLVAKALVESAEQMGIPRGDLNNRRIAGIMPSQNYIYQGKRWSAFKSYLRSVKKRNNLDIVTGYLVTKILFRGRIAIGIEIMSLNNGELSRVFARKEIILCAGVIGSPHLLLLSGVGPAEQLKKFKIPVVSDVPTVGQNLEDHLSVPLYFHMDLPLSINLAKVKSVFQVWNYFVYGTGVMSESGIEIIARTFRHGSNSTKPEFLFILFNVGSINKDIFGQISNMREEIFLQSFPDVYNESKEGFVILATCLHPLSKGFVNLQSADPLVPPLIDPRYLSEEGDIECSIEAMKMATKLINTETFRKMGVRQHLPKFPHCLSYKPSLENREFLKCWLQTNAITGNHALGTNRMGEDDLAVLDSNLRVRGIANLRVVDSSSIPGQLSGPPNAVIVAMAEKAADAIIRSIVTFLPNSN